METLTLFHYLKLCLMRVPKTSAHISASSYTFLQRSASIYSGRNDDHHPDIQGTDTIEKRIGNVSPNASGQLQMHSK